MEVTFDPAKDKRNRRVHGISLSRAEDFDTPTAFIALDDREDYGEDRFNAIGFLDGRLHYMTFTMQGSMLRVISLRKATKREESEYAEVY